MSAMAYVWSDCSHFVVVVVTAISLATFNNAVVGRGPDCHGVLYSSYVTVIFCD